MKTEAKPGFWTRLGGGRVRFQWNEPWAFRKSKLMAELRELRPGFRWAVAVGFPVLAFLVSLLARHLVGEPLRWDIALFAAVGLPASLALYVWLHVRLLSAVVVGDDWLSFSGSRAQRRWRDLESFELAAGEDFAVLAIKAKGRPHPSLIGVPLTVPLPDLAAFLESRGLRRLAGQPQAPTQLPQAAG